MGFIGLIIWAAVFILSKLIIPKPKVEQQRPSGLGDFTFPTATEGRAVALAWGTVKVRGPNVVWYGGLIQRAIYEDDQFVRWNYFIGIQFAICRGVVDAIDNIFINDKIATGGRSGTGALNVDAGSIYGGDTYGAGGVVGDGNFYAGESTQAVNPYLSAFQNPLPAYRGTSYYVFEGGYIGNADSIPPWAFRIRRTPDGLGLATSNPGTEIVNTTDANCMNVIYEVMTDTAWGLKIDPGKIDVPNFTAAAVTLAGEGNGFSMLLDNEIESSELILEIERQIDGIVYLDRSADLWRISLARDDYNPATLDVIDESVGVVLQDFARKDWHETVNTVHLLFTDIADNFKETYALAQDMANVQIQGGTVATEVKYPGVKNRTLANKLAWRELVTLSYPLAKIRLSVDRSMYDLKPGDVFKYSNAVLGLNEMIFRANRVEYGNIEEGQIMVSAVQDIFFDRVPTFSDPTVSGWVDPNLVAVPILTADTLILEAGRQWVKKSDFAPESNPRWWCGGRDSGGGTVAYQLYYRFNTSRPVTGAFSPDRLIQTFLRAGILDADLAAYGASAARPATDYSIVVTNLDKVITWETKEDESTPDTINNLITVVYIDGEYIGYETAIGSIGELALSDIHRGLFNSAPKAHASGTRVWFVGKFYRLFGAFGDDIKTDGGKLLEAIIEETQDEIDIQLRAQSKSNTVTEASTPIEEQSLGLYWKAPLPPRDHVIDGVYAPSTVDLDTSYTTETGRTGEDARAVEVVATRRAWLEDTPTLDATLPAAYLDDSPTFDVTFTLDPDGTPAVVPAYVSVDTLTVYVLRNDIIKAVGANRALPGTAKVSILAKHTPDTIDPPVEITSPVASDLDFDTVTSALTSDDLFFGGTAVSTPSAAVVFNETGNYSFDIKTALPASGVLQASIGGGGFVTIIAAGLTTGILAVTSLDSIRLQFTQAPSADQFFDVTGPTAETGYGVLEA